MLLRHLAGSLTRLWLGYGIGAMAGLAAGVSVRGRAWALVDALMGVPTMVWVPVLMVAFGPGAEAVVAAVALGAVFVVAKSTAAAVASVDEDVAGAARLDGASGWRRAVLVLIPAACTGVSYGLRLGVGYAWRALVGAEIAAALLRWGLGRLIWDARLLGDYGAMYAGLAAIAVCGAVFDRLLGGIVRVE